MLEGGVRLLKLLAELLCTVTTAALVTVTVAQSGGLPPTSLPNDADGYRRFPSLLLVHYDEIRRSRFSRPALAPYSVQHVYPTPLILVCPEAWFCRLLISSG